MAAKVVQCLYRTYNVDKACRIVLKDAVCLQRMKSVYIGCKVATKEARSFSGAQRLQRMRRDSKATAAVKSEMCSLKGEQKCLS